MRATMGALVLLAAATAPLPAFAYTQAEAQACTPDAFRLCQQAIPDEGRVAACLLQNRRQLSHACSAVFDTARASSMGRERPRMHRTRY